MADLRRHGLEQALLSLGLFLLNILFFTMILASVLFMAGIPVTVFHLPAAILAAAAVSFFFQKRSWKGFAVTVIAGLLIFALCLALAGYVDDWSWDGNSYHKGITGALCWGWNPLRESFYDFADGCGFLHHCTDTWYDAYPKASEIFAACVHIVTGNIEAGKSFTLLSMASLFFLSWGMLSQTGFFRQWQLVICAALLVLNPVSVSQIFTFYNDGFLANMLLLCLIGLLYLTFYPRGELTGLAGYFIFTGISIGFNIKFSATLFFAILCLTFFGYWAVQEFQRRCFRDCVRALRGRFFLLAASVLSGVLVLGSNAYVTNTIRYHNPVYTMIGEGSTEIITSQLPTVYQPMGHLTRFVASFFSRTNDSLYIPAVEWKLPFTVSASEIVASYACDVRIGGWGVLFSGIFLVSAAVLVLALAKCRRRHRRVFTVSVLLSVMLAVCVPVIPGLCWARYFTALFLIPAAALLFLFAWWNRSGGTGRLACALALAVLLCANLAPNVRMSLSLLKNSRQTWAQLAQLKELTETQDVTVGYGGVAAFEGRVFNLYDAGITDFTFGTIDPEDYTGTVFDRYPLYYRVGQEDG